jgi:hypothetical protein
MSDSTSATPDEAAPDGLEQGLRADYLREDERWSAANQVRDAMIILGVGVVVFAWMFIVFLLEPGIR